MWVQRPISFSATIRRQAQARRFSPWVVLLPGVLTILLGIIAYQLPTHTTLAIGEPGGRLVLRASGALDAAARGAGQWYAGEITGTGRARWARSRALITVPGFGG